MQGSWLEGRKLFFDSLKHMATLGTAAVVVTSALVKNLENSRAPWLLAVSLVLITLSTGLAWFVMVGVASVVSQPPRSLGEGERLKGTVFVVAVLAFTGGLAATALFGLVNALR